MVYKLLTALTFCRFKLAVALCSLGLCCPCLAEFWSDQNKPYHRDTYRLNLLPIQLMDDETLMQAAKHQRDGRMLGHVRLLNSQWLLQNDHNTWSGGSAIAKVLRTGFREFWHTQNQSTAQEPVFSLLEHDMTYLGNYAIGASDDKVYVGVKFEF